LHDTEQRERPIVRQGDESQLIKQAKRHDPDAISELYNRHVDQIHQYVVNRTGETAVAEDITADVFLRALESLAAYDDRGVPFAAWLYRIARARVIDYWRRTQRRATVPFEDRDLPDWVAGEDVAEGDVLQHDQLAAGLAYLTEDQQQVIVLKFMQGLSNAEVAQIMGKTEGAIKALQRRGLEALARLLKK
jgi:RNA polymerase sigma-70 factor (ECF subfamily)